MTTLYLIRHAEAEGNVFRRLHGQYDSNVTPNGQRQIVALARRFAEVPVDAVYASDLRRTCATAAAIYQPKNLPLRREPRLRELRAGLWEDQPFGWLEHSDPVRNQLFSHAPERWAVEGSEPFAVYTGRFLAALEEIARRHAGQTVAIFSHGMVLRGVMQRLFFPSGQGLAHSENTAVTKLLWDGDKYILEYMNDASHLPPEITTLGRQLWWRGDGKKDFNMWFRDVREGDASLLAALGFRADGAAQLRASVLGEHVTGLMALQPLDGEADGLVYLGLLPEFRGQGLSAQLLGEAVSLTRAHGKPVLRLAACPETAAAKRLFAAYGLADGALRL